MARLYSFLHQIKNRIPVLPKFQDVRHMYCLSKSGNNSITNDIINFVAFRFNQTKPLKCWKCGVEKNSLAEMFCAKCNFIQEPHETNNFFKLLDIEETFDIDTKSLTNKYRRLQNVIHPDKFSSKSTEEKNISQEYSSLINKAYNTLLNPLNRALHMLNLRGEKIDEDQKIADPAFLMEIMELNEKVENAESADKLRELNEKNKKTLKEIGKKVSECFKKGDVEKAKEYIIKMKYYNSTSHFINGILREKGIVD